MKMKMLNGHIARIMSWSILCIFSAPQLMLNVAVRKNVDVHAAKMDKIYLKLIFIFLRVFKIVHKMQAVYNGKKSVHIYCPII